MRVACPLSASGIPDALLERYGLVQRRCAGQTARYKDVLIYSREYKFTELDKKFVDQLYASKNEVAFREYRWKAGWEKNFFPKHGKWF